MQMDWPLKTAEKELLDTFLEFIKEKKSFLKKKELFIFGASVRGTLLALLLEQEGISNFSFIDNDKRKWGQNIHGYVIHSPTKIIESSEDFFILIPIEHSEAIVKQLKQYNLLEEERFFCLKTPIYNHLIEIFFQNNIRKKLIMGASLLNEVVIGETKTASLKEMLYENCGERDLKVLAKNCMGMKSFYYLLLRQIEAGFIPRQFLFFIHLETFTEYHHLLSRNQQPELFKQILNRDVKRNDGLEDFIKQSQIYSENYEIELKYSPKRTFEKDVDFEKSQMEYIKLGLLYPLSTKTVEFYYFTCILKLLSQYQIDSYIIALPVNHYLGKKYYKDEFTRLYRKNISSIKKAVSQTEHKWIDLSYLLDEEDFEACLTINDAFRYRGRQKIVTELNKKGL